MKQNVRNDRVDLNLHWSAVCGEGCEAHDVAEVDRDVVVRCRG